MISKIIEILNSFSGFSDIERFSFAECIVVPYVPCIEDISFMFASIYYVKNFPLIHAVIGFPRFAKFLMNFL